MPEQRSARSLTVVSKCATFRILHLMDKIRVKIKMATATGQERPKVRVPPSWVALVALAGAGVLGALYWLGPTWVRVNGSLDGAVQERTIAEEPAATVPDAMFPARRSVAPGQGSQTRGLSTNPAVAVAQLKNARLTATLSLLQVWGFSRSATVEKLAGQDPARLIKQSGLQSARLPVDWDLLARLDYPCLLDWKETADDFRHAVALVGLSATEAVILDPLVGRRVVSRPDLLQHVDGEALIVWKGLPGITVPLRAGNGTDPVVAALQRSLQKQGLLGGTVTGVYDSPTRAAVVRLQSEYGLKATGVFGVRSYMVLSKRVLGAKAPSVKARPGAPGEE
ncbi:MAG: hypothetical protein D4R81_05715 [Nitrospiraceae bacterium]|nr:MAG: hypothetical protein D4R81_05715 [Nitrospiraceae bacterium]